MSGTGVMQNPATTQSQPGLRKKYPRLVAVGFAGTLSLLDCSGLLHSVWAQQSVAKEDASEPDAQPGEAGQDVTAPQADTGRQTDKPAREPRFLPPVLRPKVLTPEELEEAERLKKLSAKFGTDPTAIVGRVQLSSQYVDLPQGGRLIENVGRVDLPFKKDWLLRLDFPFLRWADPNRSGAGSLQGLGDLIVTAGWRAYSTPEYAFFLGAMSTFPTAAEDGLGTGKYNVGPLIATARFLPRWESFLFGVFQHLLSVGGDPSRKDVELTRASLQINTIWAERWWTTVQGIGQLNWERSAKSSMTLEFEAGRNLGGRWGAYVRPGVGLWGRTEPGAYIWNIEIGIRRMFGSL
jgi:hypothetical protein